MPKIYLSPSTQEGNFYVTGGSEEYHMNQLADALEPYLRANAIGFTRNNPNQTVVSIIRQSNAGDYALHLALHSNAAPEYGTLRGVDIYYFPGSYSGQRAANIAVRRFKEIYPLPDKVRALTTTRLGEVDKVKAPALFLEIGYHDNEEDANWVTENLDTIAKTIGQTLAEYFGQPFVSPIQPQQATVSTSGSNLNIRARPSTSAAVIGSIPNGAKVTVYGLLPEWASVSYNNNIGFVNRKYLNI
ncbi:SH3 domain-containing protein [Oscillospiraceae bacterium LTW-04]|nr:SH3 domain-containing protein [Oscillospiraceae bacterium MB24-C1]